MTVQTEIIIRTVNNNGKPLTDPDHKTTEMFFKRVTQGQIFLSVGDRVQILNCEATIDHKSLHSLEHSDIFKLQTDTIHLDVHQLTDEQFTEIANRRGWKKT